MHKFSICLIFLISSMFIRLNSQNYAEKPFDARSSYGIFGNVGLNIHFADFNTLGTIPSCCPRYNSGSGLGYNFGLFYTLPVSNSMELSFRGGYYNLSAKLSEIEPEYFATPDGKGVWGNYEHSIDAKIAIAGINPLFSFKMSDELRLSAGFRAGFLMTKTIDKKEVIANPDYGYFTDSKSRIRNTYTGDIPDASSMDIALVGGASYDFPMNDAYTLFLVPEAYYYFGVTPLSSGKSWNATSFSAGIALRYAPRKIIPPPPPVIPPTLPPFPIMPQPPQEPTLDATILAVGVDTNNVENSFSTLIVEEFQRKRTQPILNYIFFDNNSYEIPSRYKRISSDEKTSFSVSRLYNLKTLEVYYQVLNIVGRKMQFYPNSNLTLIGCNSDEGSEKGNQDLSKRRAEAVKSFLVKEWGIDPTRISVKARNLPELPSNIKDPDGIIENRRVEMYSDFDKIFESMVIGDTLKVSNPPHIRFKPRVNAEIGIAKWLIKTSQHDKDLKIFKGNGDPPLKIDWDLKLEEEQQYAPRLDEPLHYRLDIIDNDNKTWSSQTQKLEVVMKTIEKKIEDMVEDKRIDRFSLIKFGFNMATVSPEHEMILNIAKKVVKPKSVVSIKGYTDRIGEESRNLELSKERAYSVARFLGIDVSKAKGYGESELLLDNDLPEGRFYSRTVNIEIVTPVE